MNVMNRDVNYLRPEVFAGSSEDWNDVYLKIKDIRKGDVFYECEQGVNYKLVATTNVRRISDGWYCNVKNSDGESFEFFVSENTNHPGVRKQIENYRKRSIFTVLFLFFRYFSEKAKLLAFLRTLVFAVENALNNSFHVLHS